MLHGHSFGWIFVTSEWVIRAVLLVVVPFRRNPEAAKGWLLLALVDPWLALVLYFLIGRPSLPRERRRHLKRLPALLNDVRARLHGHPNVLKPRIDPVLAHAATLAQHLGYLPILGGNAAELLGDYDGVIDRLVADIEAATSHVHLLFYIFADDATGRTVIEALDRATKRGVVCRVLFDAIGSRAWASGLEPRLAAAGVAAHGMLPIGILRRRMDIRNHRKIAVVDGRIAYTGSQNIVDARNPDDDLVSKELMVRVVGPVALELQAVFVVDWFLETGETLETPELFPVPVEAGTIAAQALPSGPDFPLENVQRLTVALIHGAQSRVVITTPYFIPDEALMQALETAVLRGVAVHIVVPRAADHPLVRLAQRSYYQELLEAGVVIHQYRERFLHAKHLSIDSEIALIGTSNMDIRSFALNGEISLVFYDRGLAERLRAEQEKYFQRAQRLAPDRWKRRPLPVKVGENLARLLSPLL